MRPCPGGALTGSLVLLTTDYNNNDEQCLVVNHRIVNSAWLTRTCLADHKQNRILARGSRRQEWRWTKNHKFAKAPPSDELNKSARACIQSDDPHTFIYVPRAIWSSCSELLPVSFFPFSLLLYPWCCYWYLSNKYTAGHRRHHRPFTSNPNNNIAISNLVNSLGPKCLPRTLVAIFLPIRCLCSDYIIWPQLLQSLPYLIPWVSRWW